MANISAYNIISKEFTKYDDSFFRKFIGLYNADVLNWAVNVLEKFYGPGELAQYVERNLGYNVFYDEDFISLMFTKTHFFAILVIYARLYEDIRDNDDLMVEFVKNLDLKYNRDQSSADLLHLVNNYVDEFKKRGAISVYSLAGENGNTIDGELLRLIGYRSTDEFIFAMLSNSEIGWCLGYSSPTWRNCDHITNVIKAYEFGTITSLTPYPLINSSDIIFDGRSIIVFKPSSGTPTGIGYSTSDDYILVDNTLDYEISFKIEAQKYSSMPGIEFGIDAFDVEDNSLDLNDKEGISADNNFVSFEPLKNLTTYWVRGILWNKDHVFDYNISIPVDNEKLNIGFGTNLSMTSDTQYIVPRILVIPSDSVTRAAIGEIVIRPLRFDFSLGQLGQKNFIANFRKNNVGRSDEYLDYEISNKLLPYNVVYKSINI